MHILSLFLKQLRNKRQNRAEHLTFKKPIITRVSPIKTRIRKCPFVENGPPRLRTKIQWKTLCLKLKIVLSLLLRNVYDGYSERPLQQC